MPSASASFFLSGIATFLSSEKPISGANDEKKWLPNLSKSKMPVILIDLDYRNENIKGRVIVDNENGSFTGVNYLIQRGYRNILYIAGAFITQTAKDRLSGYKKALVENNIEYDETLVKSGSYRSEWGYQAMEQFLREGIHFDAVFCGNDLIAFGAVKKLREAGIRVPEDVGVVGFDDIYVSSMMEPALTTVKQPNYEMGYRAVEMLLEVLEDKDHDPDRKIVLNTELIVRKSTR